MGMYAELQTISDENLGALLNDPSQIDGLIEADPENEAKISLDKAWHAIHFLLNKSAWEGEEPLRSAVLGHTEFGDDLGYGPPKYIKKDMVKEISKRLEAISEDELIKGYNAKIMANNEIYPQIWDEEDGENTEYIVENYVPLRVFYRDAVAANKNVIAYLT